MGKARYIARYFCSLNDPDATDTWFLIDRRTGVPVFKDGSLQLYGRKEVKALLAQPEAVAGPEVSDFAARQNSDSYLASENIKRETSPQEAEEARKDMEGVEAPGQGAETSEAQMSQVYGEKGEKLYLPEG